MSLSQFVKEPISFKPTIRVKFLVLVLFTIFICYITISLNDTPANTSKIPRRAEDIGGGFYRFEDGIWGERGVKWDFVFGGSYKSFKLEGVNATTFVPLGENCRLYGKDNEHVFYESMIIDNADVDSFECIKRNGLDHEYSKDLHSVYYKGIKVLNADPKTFEVLQNLGSGNHIKTAYARDKSRIYFNDTELVSVDYSTFSTMSTTPRSIPFVRESRQPHYAKDKTNVYRNGTKLDSADPESFQVFDSNYAKDLNDVWWWNFWRDVLIENADPQTFTVFGSGFSKDINHVYYEGRLTDIDADSFSVVPGLEYDLYFRNKSKVYYSVSSGGYHHPFIIEAADPSTFTILNSFYFKDNQHVYYIDCCNSDYEPTVHIIEGADIATFQVIDESHAQDKNSVYEKYKKVNN